MEGSLRRLGGLPGWSMVWESTPRMGLCDWSNRVVVVDPTLPVRTARCVLAHEVVHAERGPFPAAEYEREEQLVARLASCRLIGFARFEAAVKALGRDRDGLLEVLNVDLCTLRARVAALAPWQREWLEQVAKGEARGRGGFVAAAGWHPVEAGRAWAALPGAGAGVSGVELQDAS